MKRRILAALLATLAGGALTVATTPAATGAPQTSAAAAPDYSGIIALDNCSGSLVRLPNSKDTDKALAMTNGHCNENGMPHAGEVIVDKPSSRSMKVLGPDGHEIGTVTATKIAYGTMTDTDMMVYELDASYADIKSRFGGVPLEISAEHPAKGESISVVSGYFVRAWSCKVDAFIYQLKEGEWTWKDSIRYTPECATIHGTSGSPIIDNDTHKVVGINNTGNDDGQKCTMNNPCEVDEQGHVSVEKGRHYGEETHLLPACVADGNKVDLSKPDCKLPRPGQQRNPSAVASGHAA